MNSKPVFLVPKSLKKYRYRRFVKDKPNGQTLFQLSR